MRTVLLLLVLGAIAANAQHSVATLKEAKASAFSTIMDAAGATDEFSNPNAKVTLLVPSDEAVTKFLKDMGLTVADVKANHHLARALVGYHTVLGAAAGPKELFAKGDTVELPTADGHSSVIVKKTADGVTVTDAQGNVAKVSKADLGKGNHRVHVIDKVLYSASYFKDIGALLKLYPNMFSTVTAAATKAGLAATLTKQDFANTLFLPTNKAFEAAKIKVDATPKATLEEVLKYHVVPGSKDIPNDFKSGEKVPTLLKGQDVVVTFKDEGKLMGVPTKRAFVNSAKVIKPNIMVSKGTVHVIDGVLTPKAAAVTTEAAPKPAGRKLMQGHGGSGGGGRAGYRSDFGPTLSMDAAEQAIALAVQDPNAASTRTATSANLVNSQILSLYPQDAQYADGISGARYGSGAGK